MILLGFDEPAKSEEIARYATECGARKVVIFSPERLRCTCLPTHEHEHVEWAEIIKYKFYYRLLQEIDASTVLVVNECLRTQNRHDLTYNCLRLYVQQTPHVLVFQTLPLIDTWDDFAILFDLDTKSRWKKEKIGPALLREAKIRVHRMDVAFRAIDVITDDKTKTTYARTKADLLAEVRGDPGKDPHNVPRNLYMLGGKAKAASIDQRLAYIARNDRLKRDNVITFRAPKYTGGPYTVLEFPHNFIDYADFVTLSRQADADVLVADLKVDRWYFDRYQAWSQRIRGAYDMLAEGGATCV